MLRRALIGTKTEMILSSTPSHQINLFSNWLKFEDQAMVVRRANNTIESFKNRHAAEKDRQNLLAIHRVVIYLVDCVIYPSLKQMRPDSLKFTLSSDKRKRP